VSDRHLLTKKYIHTTCTAMRTRHMLTGINVFLKTFSSMKATNFRIASWTCNKSIFTSFFMLFHFTCIYRTARACRVHSHYKNEIEKALTYQVAVMFLVNFSNITHQRYIFLSVNTPTELEKVITPVNRKVTYQWSLAVFLSVSKVTQKTVKFWEWYGFVQKADN